LGEALAELAKFAALLVLQSGIPQAQEAYTPIAVCIAFSIIAHSSTDVPIARMFDVEDLVGIPNDEENSGKSGRCGGRAPCQR
jgi:hypothetical protein